MLLFYDYPLCQLMQRNNNGLPGHTRQVDHHCFVSISHRYNMSEGHYTLGTGAEIMILAAFRS